MDFAQQVDADDQALRLREPPTSVPACCFHCLPSHSSFLTPLVLAGTAGEQMLLRPADASSACGFAAPSGCGSSKKIGRANEIFSVPQTGERNINAAMYRTWELNSFFSRWKLEHPDGPEISRQREIISIKRGVCVSGRPSCGDLARTDEDTGLVVGLRVRRIASAGVFRRLVEAARGSVFRYSGKQSKSEALLLFDKLWFCAVVCSHSQNDFARNTHAHVLQIAIVAHNVLNELIPSRPAACPHPLWRDAVMQPAGRDDFQAIAINDKFNVCSGEKIVAVNERVHNRLAQHFRRVRGLLDSSALFEGGSDRGISPDEIQRLFDETVFHERPAGRQ